MLFKSFNSMQGQCNINFLQYYSLINSIPRIFISKLKEATNTNSLVQYKTFYKSFLEKVSKKYVYNLLIQKTSVMPTFKINKWESIFEFSITNRVSWSNIFLAAKKRNSRNKASQFSFQIN